MEKKVVNFKEVVRETAKTVGMKQKDVEQVLRTVYDVTAAALAEVTPDMSVEVKVLQSGVSLISEYVAPHSARNPQTGETVEVAAKNRVKAKVYSGFKKEINA